MRKDAPPYIDVLETAYDVSAEPERFDDLFSIAKTYFFADENSARIRDSLPRDVEPIDSLDRRMRYLSDLLEDQLGNKNQPRADTFHAHITISPQSFMVKGNQAASKLVGREFPCRLDQLPFDHRTQKMIEANLRPGSQETEAKDRVFLALVGDAVPRSCLALVERPLSSNADLHIAISYIHWSAELLEHLSEAFGLTNAQSKILDSFLNNQSQKDIAAAKGISVETVKDHSRAILQKTNCTRMTDVIQLSASIAYLLRHYEAPQDVQSLTEWKTPEENLRILERPDGRSLAWYEYGSGPKTVLFVHGYIQGPFFDEAFLTGIEQMGVRLICPSRPGYGYSSASKSRHDFDEMTVADTAALVESLGLKKFSIISHQGGASHAFRIANAMADKVDLMLQVDGGIPIDEKRYLKHMHDFARMGAVACKHAPSIMTMLMNLGMPIYKKRGIEKFLQEYHKSSPIDLKSINDPKIMRLNAYGCFHSMEQGVDVWVRDGASAMANWDSDFDALQAPQHWLHPRECPVMGVQFVEEYIARKLNQEIEIVDDVAFNILYQRPDIVLNFIKRHLKV